MKRKLSRTRALNKTYKIQVLLGALFDDKIRYEKKSVVKKSTGSILRIMEGLKGML